MEFGRFQNVQLGLGVDGFSDTAPESGKDSSLACRESDAEPAKSGVPITIAVPLPLAAGHFSPYQFSTEIVHAKPLNLASKARLAEDEVPILAPIVSLSEMPLNVPSYIPKFKGKRGVILVRIPARVALSSST